MDTSQTYIKMCEKAWVQGDWYQTDKLRQDQLQEMVTTGHLNDDIFNIAYFYENRNRLIQPESWEQLWLAFVMKEKYNKVWNGEDWV